MSRKQPPSFDFYPDDFLGGTYYMDAIEVGMYIRSICFQWSNDTLPNNTKALARICGVSDDVFAEHWPQVAEKFVSDGNGCLFNERLKSVKERSLCIIEKRREAGRKGGEANAKQMPKQTTSKGKRKMEEEVEDGRRKKEDGSSEDGSRVALVVQHYQTYHPRAQPGQKERAKIEARLGEGYSVEDLKSAIDGCHRSQFHCGVNDDQRKYQTLELIVRDASKVNQFLEVPEIGSEPVFDKKTQRSVLAGHSWLDRKEREENGQK